MDSYKSKKSTIYRKVTVIIWLLLYTLYLYDAYIQRQNYNDMGFTTICMPNNPLLEAFAFIFWFFFAYIGVVGVEKVLYKQWSKSITGMLIISIIGIIVFGHMMIFDIGYMSAFSKDEISNRYIWSFNSKTYKWSDADSIKVSAKKVPQVGKSSSYLEGTYNIYFKNGTYINLWGRNGGFIDHYDEIKNIVQKNNIKVYKEHIDEETREYIKLSYKKDKKRENIIFEMLD